MNQLNIGEEGYEKLFYHATVGIVVVDSSGSIELVNLHAAKIFNYSVDEIIGSSLELLIPKKLRTHHKKLRNDFISNPKTREMGKGMTLNGLKNNNIEFPVEISLSHYTIGDQRKSVAFISDITDRRKTETDLELLNIELEEKVKFRTQELEKALTESTEHHELKNTFISIASHEFRTPLTTLLSSIQLIQKYIQIGRLNEIDKHFSRCKNSIDRLTYILDDFLSIDKLDAGTMETSSGNFNIKSSIFQIIEELEFHTKHNQKITYKHEGTQRVHHDKEKLHNIIYNLISNAVKYSKKNVEVSSSFDGETLKFVVSDKGVGISETDLPKVFDKFYRAENINIVQGTGMGLYIVKRYVELLNGSVEIQSEVNNGTRVIVKLKLTRNNG